ncbi:MAG: 30S ribosomal protein S9 [Chitinivibrionales bacterium]|nr:30S ribosomal protein S9 [Chitinivibrionales bacterium]
MEGRLTATGKRKNAIACVILKQGKGERMINGRPIKEYLRGESLLYTVEEPFRMLEVGESYDMVARVKGGGLSGQAGALRLGVSRALAQVSEDYRKKLRTKGFVTRDPRVVERKKYGQAGARRRFQFSKR